MDVIEARQIFTFFKGLAQVATTCTTDMAEGLNGNQTISSLEEIFLSDAPPSLQRVLLTIQPYDFEIKYIPGKEVALADAVSRVNV